MYLYYDVINKYMYYKYKDTYRNYQIHYISYLSRRKQKQMIKPNLFIDTSISIISIYAYFHPYSPRPQLTRSFLFTL